MADREIILISAVVFHGIVPCDAPFNNRIYMIN